MMEKLAVDINDWPITDLVKDKKKPLVKPIVQLDTGHLNDALTSMEKT